MSPPNSSSPPDEQLVRGIRRNDPETFEQLYYRYFPELIRFALRRVRSTDIARDLVQDLFMRVWGARHRLDPERSVKAYLYHALNNLIINQGKLRSSQTVSLEQEGTEVRAGDDRAMEFRIDIQNALDRLPEKLKTVYTLSRFEGFKYAEIAEICNISEKTVEKRMSQAFSFLSKVFRKEK